MTLSPEQHREFFRRMLTIRRFEERVVQLGNRGDFPGHYHVYIGQEATGVPIAAALEDGDTVVTTHRNHGHALARGADPRRVLAEILGRDAGYSNGKGGSLHVSVPSLGIISASAIVAGSIPTATGAALAYRYGEGFPKLKVSVPPAAVGGSLDEAPSLRGHVAVAFFGDGALNEGAWHESAVLATWWKLPVIYVCENNDAVPYSPGNATMCATSLADYAASYGMAAVAVDGTSVEEVWAAFRRATDRTRGGLGPSFLECRTARWPGNRTLFPSLPIGLTELEHAWNPPADGESSAWYAHDPVLRQARLIVDRSIMSRADLAKVDAECRALAQEADSWAHAQPFPPAERAFEQISG